VAGDDGQHLAPRGLAGADARGAVLEHQHVLVGAAEAEALAPQQVAGGIRLAVGDGLGRDDVRGGGQLEDVEPLWSLSNRVSIPFRST
jgi:hypothetical protein